MTPQIKKPTFTDAHVHGKLCVHTLFNGELCAQPVVQTQHGWLCEKHEAQVHKK